MRGANDHAAYGCYRRNTSHLIFVIDSGRNKASMAAWSAFFLAFTALLPLINPLGSALVFLGLVGSAPPAVYRNLARSIAISNVIFLGIFELLGSTILHFFGISLPIVQFAGGIVIAAMGWGVLNQNQSTSVRVKEEEFSDQGSEKLNNLSEKIFYPFTFPITSGPGTLVGLLTLSAHMSGHTVTSDVLSHLGVFIAVVVLSIVVYFCYAYAPKITSKISPSTAHGVLRVVAFILFCIGVQIAWNGLSFLLKTLLKG
jgi:multiple antibiotic resistance protein